MNILKRMVSLLPIIVMGIALAFLLPDKMKAWNPVYDLDIRSLFLVFMTIGAYIIGFITIKNLIKQEDYQILRHLDILMIINSIFFGHVIGVFPYHLLSFLRNYQSEIWAIFAITALFALGKICFIFRTQNADVVLLSIC